jgi:hypothetical protein
MSKEDSEVIGLDEAFCHPWKKLDHIRLSGQLSSTFTQYYSVRIYNCRQVADDPDKDCASEEDIKATMEFLNIHIFYKNYYFDTLEFDSDPIKSSISMISQRLLSHTV